MYIAHTVPGRHKLKPVSLVLYLEEEEHRFLVLYLEEEEHRFFFIFFFLSYLFIFYLLVYTTIPMICILEAY